MNIYKLAEVLSRRRSEVVNEFLELHLRPRLPAELQSSTDPTVLQCWVNANGYNLRQQGDWTLLFKDNDRIASLYVEMKL